MYTKYFVDSDAIQRGSNRLEKLPFEILSHIGSYLSDKDLISVRLCSNRAIQGGFDDPFVQRFFRHRKLKMTESELGLFEKIIHSRFAARIQQLDLSLSADIPMPLRVPAYKMDKDLVLSTKICADLHHCEHKACARLVEYFQCMTQLSRLVIYPPAELMARHDYFSQGFDNQVEEHTLSARGVGSSEVSLSHLIVPIHWSPRAQFHSILGAIAAAEVQLKSIQMRCFTKCWHTALFAPATPILRHLASAPRLQTLVSLGLDLDVVSHNRHTDAVAALRRLLQDNAHLKHLALNLLPARGLFVRNLDREVACTRLLSCLGYSPPFSLQSLHLRGLYAGGLLTLDRVIANHKKTFESITLEETNFNAPNRLRHLLVALLDTQLNFLLFDEFVLNHKYVLQPFRMMSQDVEDVDPLWTSGEDESFRGWVKLTRDPRDDGSEIRFDCRNLPGAKTMMKEVLGDLIRQIDTGTMGPGV
ncbi:hypothetical protein FB567DRAFT_236281 [Paraphoma chrysanthemicola]|uniref:F-box domain-containing protein n=1 Tax=Paraphoma chrysanthemicola TaxID=798071 RepID=A0A8K0W1Z2_9PLEO|nr:hypothetical protein FB567DRAFT_236281 [Paraphoma chrysanthemicola]